jgi:membrane peptidoglycan carboxypeptidase
VRRGAVRAGSLAAVLALLLTACADIVTLELPTLQGVARTPPTQSVVYDADGNELAVLRHEFREPVGLGDLPQHLMDAVLVAEDRRFFAHRGVDLRAVTRAAAANVASGEVGQGGSTITQQLVKALYMPDAERSTETKLLEAMLARDLEQRLGKAEILEEYFNAVYFGEGAYGIEAAAETYFRVDASELDLAQSALLAAIIRAPESLAPTREPEAARIRRDDVLERMAEEGRIDPAARDEALATDIEVHDRPPSPPTQEPHFVDFVVRTLLADPRLGTTEADRAQRIYGGGLRIHTTLRTDVQRAAREVLASHLPDPGDPEAAIALVEPATGHVVAAVGNRAYEDLQYDLPTQARRPPGSTFKTFVLAAAITDGWHPEDRLDGSQGEVQAGWEVRNYDRRDYANATLVGATRMSLNASFARLGLEIGIPRVAGTAHAMGVRSPVPTDDPQIALGGGSLEVTPLDLAAAYATIGNLGAHVPTTPVTHIEDRSGTTVWIADGGTRPALAPSAAYVTAEVLRESVERGTGQAARVAGWEVAGKTGTTSNHTDAWFVGTTPTLAGAVWLGHAEGLVPMRGVRGVAQVTGGSIPARIFSDVMTRALADQEPVPFELPDDEWEWVEIDPGSGLRAAKWCPGERERLPRVLVPRETCPRPAPQPEPPPAPEPEPGPEPEPRHERQDDTRDADEPTPRPDPPEQAPERPEAPTPAPAPEPDTEDDPDGEDDEGGDGAPDPQG